MRGWLCVAVCCAVSLSGCGSPARPAEARYRSTSPTDAASVDKLLEGRYLSVAEIRAKGEWEVERSIRFSKLVRGNPRSHDLALTFDDGPHPRFTPQLLRVLDAAGVKATFFVIGKMVDKHPELVAAEAAAGHEVANHTYSHRRLPTLTDAGIEGELRKGADAIRRAIGEPTKLYRPPGGEYDMDVVNVTRRLDYCMVLWTDDPSDFANPGAPVVLHRTMRAVSNGGILLLHDGVQETLDILPALLTDLKARGFRFVTCAQMAKEPGVVTSGGPDTYHPSR